MLCCQMCTIVIVSSVFRNLSWVPIMVTLTVRMSNCCFGLACLLPNLWSRRSACTVVYTLPKNTCCNVTSLCLVSFVMATSWVLGVVRGLTRLGVLLLILVRNFPGDRRPVQFRGFSQSFKKSFLSGRLKLQPFLFSFRFGFLLLSKTTSNIVAICVWQSWYCDCVVLWMSVFSLFFLVSLNMYVYILAL